MLPTPSTQNAHSWVMWVIMKPKCRPKKPVMNDSGRKDRRNHGELLHHVVLAIADGRQVEIGRGGEQITVGVDQVADADQMVVDIAEVVALIEFEAGELGDLVNPVGERSRCGVMTLRIAISSRLSENNRSSC